MKVKNLQGKRIEKNNNIKHKEHLRIMITLEELIEDGLINHVVGALETVDGEVYLVDTKNREVMKKQTVDTVEKMVGMAEFKI